ncbi:hypothetical protein ACLKA6_006969 [Drosophila palustris]
MDDMVYQCSNQNSIYVLNAGYNPSYGDFGTHATTKTMTATGREMNDTRTTRTATRNSIGASCSKFKSFGNSSVPATTTIIAAAAAATTIGTAAATTTATATTTNYINPVATSMSTAMCSPATTALQKLFNCSVVGGNVCQNVSHRNEHNHSNHSNHNNCPVGSLLSATSSHSRICDPHESSAATGAIVAGTVGTMGASIGATMGAGALPLLSKKKCTNVKSTLIAKKTKFLKFLEEEKWRSDNNNFSTENADACRAAPVPPASSNEADLYTAITASSLAIHSGSKHNIDNINSQEAAGTEQEQEQQIKLNNWSMHNDNNNKSTNYTQQQQKETTTRSSYELYQEAADILGLSCSLCDNCRCLDCQSGYFDCADDDDESYSEQSLMDEYDEYDEYSPPSNVAYGGGGYELEASHLTNAHHAGHNQLAMTQQQLQQQQQGTGQQATDLNLCYAVDCQQNCSSRTDDDDNDDMMIMLMIMLMGNQ